MPVLHRMLEDPDDGYYWRHIALLIAKIGRLEESVPPLVTYLTRDEPWEKFPDGTASLIARWKITALQLIGHIGGPEANDVLRKAISEDGARELLSAWIDKAPISQEDRERLFLVHVRYSAAHGLLRTEEVENFDFVENVYDSLEGEPDQFPIYRKLKSVLALRDVLETMTYDDLGNLSLDERSALVGKEFRKYDR